MVNTNNSCDALRMGDNSFRFISFNIKGVNGPIKCSRVFAHLKAGVIFLQETHLKVSDHV